VFFREIGGGGYPTVANEAGQLGKCRAGPKRPTFEKTDSSDGSSKGESDSPVPQHARQTAKRTSGLGPAVHNTAAILTIEPTGRVAEAWGVPCADDQAKGFLT